MIIWLNGAFGSGKTTTAFELHHMLKDSFVYDPEKVGYFLTRYEPKEFRGDNFQDKPLWRKFNYEMIKNMALNYKGTMIIPMTIVKEAYYYEIISKLRNDGIRIDHYVLGASEDTLIKRGRSRLCFKNSWSVKQFHFVSKALKTRYLKIIFIPTPCLRTKLSKSLQQNQIYDYYPITRTNCKNGSDAKRHRLSI